MSEFQYRERINCGDCYRTLFVFPTKILTESSNVEEVLAKIPKKWQYLMDDHFLEEISREYHFRKNGGYEDKIYKDTEYSHIVLEKIDFTEEEKEEYEKLIRSMDPPKWFQWLQLPFVWLVEKYVEFKGEK